MNLQIGYCTNVHAGANLQQMRENLATHAVAVKSHFSPDKPMGIGLWFSAASARELRENQQVSEFADWLAEEGLVPFTFNGFPHGDFHQSVVKHLVYEPRWFDEERLRYTRDLFSIHHQLLPEGLEGSISTLPLAWGSPHPTETEWQQAADLLVQAAETLAQLRSETGRLIYLCIEPEPGCALQYSDDIIAFYKRWLLPTGDEEMLRTHIRVCHDVCHAAVMFEDQSDVIDQFTRAGIKIGKVQVSSAICAPFGELAPETRLKAFEQLSEFAEDRYLHQTMIRRTGHTDDQFREDLPAALRAVESPAALAEQWRVHFHVPIYLAEFGYLKTTQSQIEECLSATKQLEDMTHYEVETYAWNVLPAELQQPELAAGIADELKWFQTQLEAYN